MNNWWIVLLDFIKNNLHWVSIIAEKIHDHDFKELHTLLIDLTLG